MKKQYDLKKIKWKSNPYIKFLKKPVTIRVDEDVLEYFKRIAQSEQIPYQTLIASVLHKYVTGLLAETSRGVANRSTRTSGKRAAG